MIIYIRIQFHSIETGGQNLRKLSFLDKFCAEPLVISLCFHRPILLLLQFIFLLHLEAVKFLFFVFCFPSRRNVVFTCRIDYFKIVCYYHENIQRRKFRICLAQKMDTKSIQLNFFFRQINQ